MRLVIIAILLLLARGARDFMTDPGAGTALALGLLLVVGYFVGEALEHIKLPRLTGYILTGLACGPYGLGLVGQELGTLKLANGTAVVVIAMTAGNELDLRALRPLAKSIIVIVTVAVMCSAIMITGATFASRELFGFLSELDTVPALAVCATLGVVLSAQSPAVVVALRKETNASGILPDTVLGAVVIGDLLVIGMFAIAQSVAGGIMGGDQDVIDQGLHLLWHVLGSAAIGAIAGSMLGRWLARTERGEALLVVVSCFVLAEVGQRLQLDAIVLAVVAGAMIRNRRPDATHRLETGLNATASTMYVLFFCVAGASLHLDALLTLGLPVLLIVICRAIGMFGGARLGAHLVATDPLVRRWAGVGLLPQAGLALALALVLARVFPTLEQSAVALVLGVVAVNELVAPALWRAVLMRTKKSDAAPSDGAPSEAPATPNAPGDGAVGDTPNVGVPVIP